MARKTSGKVNAQPAAIDPSQMSTWTSLVDSIAETNPKKDELTEDEALECATVIEELSKYLVKHWKTIGKICEKEDPKKLSISLSASLDRTSHPAQISTRIGYAEKHGEGRKVAVPDPNQMDLPMSPPAGDGNETE